MLLENTIHLGDCLELMKQIPDASVDMVLCDLPYGTTACKWDVVIPFEHLWKAYKRIVKPGAAIALFGSEPFASQLRLSQIENYKYDWYWYKNNATGIALSKYQPMRAIETISVFYKERGTFNKQLMKSRISDRALGKSNGKINFDYKNETTHGMKRVIKKDNPKNILKEWVNPRNVLEFKVVPRAKGTLHPTQKPTDLCEYLIKTYTNPEDLVLDNCAGSGTTAVACKQTGRKYLCIEKDPEYWLKACDRVNQSQSISLSAMESS